MTPRPPQPPTPATPLRRGSAYIAVLGAAMVVTIIGLGALSLVRSQRLIVTTQTDAASARLAAESAVEWGAQIISAQSGWRTTRTNGEWAAGQDFGGSKVTLEVTDPLDGNLANRPTDPVQVRATATRGPARQILQATLTASGPPLDCLRTAFHTGSRFRVRSPFVLTVSGAPASTNSDLRNEGTIAGDAECVLLTSAGTVTGTLTVAAPAKPLPPSGVVSLYANLGTVIDPGGTLSNVALGPGLNPYGTPNSEGVYVINAPAGLTISRVRVLGTLVVICPGATVTISGQVHMSPARADYPALIVDGNVAFSFTSGSSLSESTPSPVNFNPAGVPYSGATDADTTDVYPSEVRGLVHCRGNVTTAAAGRVVGAVIAEGELDAGANFEVSHTPSLATSPPMGYMKSVSMSVSQGSWRQVVVPAAP
ncbi:MAG: hypothetical protein WD749_01240 [Phycisphaerales bacterium]